MASIARLKSWFVRLEPEGKQRPRVNKSSATAPPIHSQPANTGCRCNGFHTGRVSICCSASATRICSQSAPNSLGLIVKQVSHRVANPKLASGINSSPGKFLKARWYTSKLRRLAATRSLKTRN